MRAREPEQLAMLYRSYIPLLEALANGKTIQWTPLLGDAHGEVWKDLTRGAINDLGALRFDLPANCYRIKPELREIHQIFYRQHGNTNSPLLPDKGWHLHSTVLGTHWVRALNNAKSTYNGYEWKMVHYREVME